MNGDTPALDLAGLLRRLPHRYPFLMVDRVLEFGGDRVLTLKNVSIDEPFFNGHFPGRPVMPGVLVVEAMAQSGALLALGLMSVGTDAKSAEAARTPALFMLTGIDHLRLRRPVVPGDQLRMEVRLLKHRRPLWKMQAEARVDGELVAAAELSAMEVEESKP
ncbi:MAG TPA: 3-hydroxyacyl-ACP dehydratase FabZ [Candidatus Binataceae bacterium]